MRSLPVKSSVRPGVIHASPLAKRRQKTTVAAHRHVRRQGFRDEVESGAWLDTELQVEHRPESGGGDDANENAKHRFQREFEAQLEDWDAMLERLKARARGASAEVRAEFEVQLEALAGDRALAQERLQELRRHGQWAWEDLKDDAERTWKELREAIERSASYFN